MRLLITLLLAGMTGAAAQVSWAEPAATVPTLAVPFLAQTEWLCGGAAAAMIFRYWGEKHADVQQFAPLVDRKAGGIANVALIRAIEERGWRTQRLDGTIATLQAQVEARRPVMVLIEDRPRRYHFVVVVAADSRHVAVHDPAWGPARRYDTPDFMNAWKPSGYWALLVTPRDPPTVSPPPASVSSAHTPTACDAAMEDAVATVRVKGLETADAVFDAVRARCPESSRPLSEMAGIRLAQRRFDHAAMLARQALAIDPSDVYAWDVLGSSLFVQDDIRGAIEAWNAIQRPRLDSVSIDGLARLRYATLATSLPLETNRVLTADGFALAARRLDEHPAFVTTRLGLMPNDDGWAVARVAVVERAAAPRGWAQWSVAATAALVNREIRADLPGWTGQGDVWSARWQWWRNRPAFGLALTTPTAARLGGVWTVEGDWQSQQYATITLPASIRERRTRGGVTRSDWATPNLRYEISGGLYVWDGARRAIQTGIGLDRRLASDRIAIEASAKHWWGLNGAPDFRAADSRVTFRSSVEDRGLAMLADAGVAAVSTYAPPSEWPSAGDVGERSPLLRAHPLTTDGIVDGKGFGRKLLFASFEPRRWFETPGLVRLGSAAFVDVARAWDRVDSGTRGSLVIDAGAGIRIRLPGKRAMLRVDYGHGFRDSADALTFGWQR